MAGRFSYATLLLHEGRDNLKKGKWYELRDVSDVYNRLDAQLKDALNVLKICEGGNDGVNDSGRVSGSSQQE